MTGERIAPSRSALAIVHPVPTPRLRFRVLASVAIIGAVACAPDRQPANPPSSALLDAVGLAPAALGTATCTPAASPPSRDWSMAAVHAVERFVWGAPRMCDLLPVVSDGRGGFAFGWATVDPHGHVVHASRSWTAATAREAEVAIDSMLTRAAAHPATVPITCGFDRRLNAGFRSRWPFFAGVVHRAFREPGYDVNVFAQEQPDGRYSIRADASTGSAVGCRPGPVWPGPTHVARPVMPLGPPSNPRLDPTPDAPEAPSPKPSREPRPVMRLTSLESWRAPVNRRVDAGTRGGA